MLSFARATVDDAPTLCAASTPSFDDDARRFFGMEAGGPPGYNDLQYHISLAASTAYKEQYTYYKILWDQEIIGGIVIFPQSNDTCHLGCIFILPEYQSRGLGAQCLAFLDQEYPKAKRWTLSTPSCCTRNQHFYEKHGFVKVGEEGEPEPGDFPDWKYERITAKT